MAGDSMTSEVIEDEKQFYSKAKTYWKEVPATVDGMLGGYGHISSIDITSSRKFLQRFLRVGRAAVLSRRRGGGAGGTACSAWGATFPLAASGSPHCVHDPGLEEQVGRVTHRLCPKVTRQEAAVTLGPLGAGTEQSPHKLFYFSRGKTFALLPCLQASGLWVLAVRPAQASCSSPRHPPLCQAGIAVAGASLPVPRQTPRLLPAPCSTHVPSSQICSLSALFHPFTA